MFSILKQIPKGAPVRSQMKSQILQHGKQLFLAQQIEVSMTAGTCIYNG